MRTLADRFQGFRAHRTAFSGFRLWTGAFVEAVRPTTCRRRESEPSTPKWIGRRALLAVPVVAGVTALTFVLIHLAPGDPIYALAGDGGPAYYADMRAATAWTNRC